MVSRTITFHSVTLWTLHDITLSCSMDSISDADPMDCPHAQRRRGLLLYSHTRRFWADVALYIPTRKDLLVM